MTIIITGGWGYQNLGDDAILKSTLGKLRESFPMDEIVFLTEEHQDNATCSPCHLDARVSQARSAHSIRFGDTVAVMYPDLASTTPITTKILRKLGFGASGSIGDASTSRSEPIFLGLENLIKSSKLFVIAGGGYLNEKWIAKSSSTLFEAELAIKHNVPLIVLGPSLGLFEATLAKRLAKVLNQARLVVVRDTQSFEFAARHNGNTRLLADIAFSPNVMESKAKNHQSIISVVITSAPGSIQQNLVSAIKKMNWPTLSPNQQPFVDIIVTRRWKYDVHHSWGFQKSLQRAGIGSVITIPSDVELLERALSETSLLISENLHGLIIAARAGIPVIAINSYTAGSPNHRKFKSFLAHIGRENYSIDQETSSEQILRMLETSQAEADATRQTLRLLAKQNSDSYSHELARINITGEDTAHATATQQLRTTTQQHAKQ